MKKIYHLFSIIAAVACCSMFTSCVDDDTEEARVLYGQWQGNWGMYYTTIDPYGNEVTFDSYDTDIEFIQEGSYKSYGYGYQVDYYRRGPYERISSRFNWSVNNGVIYITYPRNPEYNTTIRDYRLSDNYFTGYFDNGTEAFRLQKLVNYDWSSYYEYDYYEWPAVFDWYEYYAKERQIDLDDTSSMKKAPQKMTVNGKDYDPKNPPVIKMGSRLAEK